MAIPTPTPKDKLNKIAGVPEASRTTQAAQQARVADLIDKTLDKKYQLPDTLDKTDTAQKNVRNFLKADFKSLTQEDKDKLLWQIARKLNLIPTGMFFDSKTQKG